MPHGRDLSLLLVLLQVCRTEGGRAAYSEWEAIGQAHLATAVYCGAEVKGWGCGAPCEWASLYGLHPSNAREVTSPGVGPVEVAFVGKQGGICVVGFRGTANLKGWLTDLSSGVMVDTNDHGVSCSWESRPCKVGKGWMTVYSAIKAAVVGNLSDIGCSPGQPLSVVGHSLGAAVAQVALYDLVGLGFLPTKSYVFGSPRTGNAQWAAAFLSRVGYNTLFRVVHGQDPVPHLPPLDLGYANIGTEVYYPADVRDGYQICTGPSDPFDPQCSAVLTNLTRMIAHCVEVVRNCDHLTYMFTVKPSRMDGETCAGRNWPPTVV